MKEYKNIEKVETLDDGTMSIFMKNGKQAIIEIIKFNEKFQAAVYNAAASAKLPLDAPGTNQGKKDNLLTKLEHFDVYKECAKDAIGWVDENPLPFVEREEIKIDRLDK